MKFVYHNNSMVDVNHVPKKISEGGEKVGDWILDKLGDRLEDMFINLLEAISTNIPSIVSIIVVFCALAMMVAPLYGSRVSLWFNRIFLALLGGVIWKMLF